MVSLLGVFEGVDPEVGLGDVKLLAFGGFGMVFGRFCWVGLSIWSDDVYVEKLPPLGGGGSFFGVSLELPAQVPGVGSHLAIFRVLPHTP